MMEIRTLRPLGGLVGSAVIDESYAVQRVLDVIESNLDGGEGWLVRRPGGLTWFPSRLSLDVSESHANGHAVLWSDVVVVRQVERVSPDLLVRLNDLNAHAAGWVYWFDSDQQVITSTMVCPVEQKAWWWCWALLLTHQHQVTVAESIADELAELAEGEVAVISHPERGVRLDVDGWIIGARLGAREPSASLDLFLTSLDYQMLLESLETLVAGFTIDDLSIKTWCPLDLEIAAPDGRVLTRMHRHWHPEHGWGVQVPTVARVSSDEADPGDFDSLVAMAARWNTDIVSSGSAYLLGGWVAVRALGLVHQTFIPAVVLEHVAHDAQDSFGSVLALMAAHLAEAVLPMVPSDVPTSEIEAENEALRDATSRMQILLGPVGWSYAHDREHQPTGIVPDRDGSEEQTDAYWRVPRHLPVCSFGIFNPMGPTVSSLEVAQIGDEWVLLFVLRNPFGPRIEEWGRADIDDESRLDILISNALAETEGGPMGPGPDWMDIFSHRSAVLDGISQFAQESDPETLAFEANALLHYYADPWARLNKADGPIELTDRAIRDPARFWINTITDPEVIAGHQLFIRSAWEGAKAMVDSGFEAAQAVTDAQVNPVRSRVMGDYSFRGETGLLVQHPLT